MRAAEQLVCMRRAQNVYCASVGLLWPALEGDLTVEASFLSFLFEPLFRPPPALSRHLVPAQGRDFHVAVCLHVAICAAATP